jgi:CRISPR-associated protein Cas4
MESYIRISTLNDFVFCPKSIYFHELYDKFDETIYQEEVQHAGKLAHETIDEKTYSTAKKYIQSLSVYSDRYKLCGKIDIYNTETKTLVERKNKVVKVYDGYKYQLYAQYRCMTEMGYEVKNLTIYSLKDNIKYDIPLPTGQEQLKFERLIHEYKKFNPNAP